MKVISKMLLVSLGIGILAFAGGCGQEGLPAGMSPEDVITKALLNQTEYTQAVFEMKADADLKGEVEGEQNSLYGNFVLSGSSNSETEEMSIVLNVDADMNSEKFKGKLELRSTEDGVFINIGSVDVSDKETQELVALFLEEYLGVWVKLTFMTSEELVESGFMDVDYNEGDALPFKNIEYKGTEDILGLKSYHFTAEIDEKLVMDLMEGAETSDAKAFFDAADIKGDVYVAVNEMVLTGFGGAMVLDDPEMNGTMNMLFKINPTKSAKVTTPDYEKEFTEEDVMGLMFGGAMMQDPSMMEFDESMMEGDPMLEDTTMSDEDFEVMMEELEASGELPSDPTTAEEMSADNPMFTN